MNEKKNIDRLFQEKFKDFEVAPSDAVWDRINESLPNKKKKRRVIPIWWQIGGVAAAIALLLTIGISVFDFGDDTHIENPIIVDIEQKDPVNNTSGEDSSQDKNQKTLNKINDVQDPEIVDAHELKESSDEESTSDHISEQEKISNKLIPNGSSKADALVNNDQQQKDKSEKPLINAGPNDRKALALHEDEQQLKDKSKLDETEMKSTIKEAIEDDKTSVAESSSSETSGTASNDLDKEKEKETVAKEDPSKESILDAIADNTEDINEKEDEQSRWSIRPNVAPVYFSSLGQGSTIHSQFTSNSKNSDINMSYGISGSYAITKKLSVRAGVNRVDLNYATADVIAFNGTNTAARSADAQGNINFKNGSFVSLVSSEVLNRSSTPEALNTKITGDIDQRFGFIEVPLELEYRLLDKKFGLNVIGGFSTFFLNQNDIYADIDGTSTLIGEASNINSTSFSANFGLGLDYDLSKQWNINLEPQFKYQINTFNNTFGDFRPFFIGVYTGLSFKF